MTADRTAPLSPAKALKKVCELYTAGNFSEARRIITECAGITPEERSQIPVGGMGRYIAQKTKNPNIHKMLQAELAFYSFQEIRRTEDPSEFQAEVCIENFQKIMPFLHKFGKTYAKYCIACCSDYSSEYSDEQKLQIINDFLNSFPKGQYDSQRYSFALKINDLDISVAEKYDSIKQVQKKTSAQSHAQVHYKEMLAKLASQYYDVLMRTAQNRQNDYQTRNQAYETVLDVIDDLALSKLKKNSYKLALLEQQTNLQKEYGDRENYIASSKRKYTLIRQQAALKRKVSGIRIYENYDYK